jgi:hypothetical protein
MEFNSFNFKFSRGLEIKKEIFSGATDSRFLRDVKNIY